MKELIKYWANLVNESVYGESDVESVEIPSQVAEKIADEINGKLANDKGLVVKAKPVVKAICKDGSCTLCYRVRNPEWDDVSDEKYYSPSGNENTERATDDFENYSNKIQKEILDCVKRETGESDFGFEEMVDDDFKAYDLEDDDFIDPDYTTIMMVRK